MEKPVINNSFDDDLSYGDWRCASCSYINFGKRTLCTECRLPRRGGASARGRGGGLAGRSGVATLPAPVVVEEERPAVPAEHLAAAPPAPSAAPPAGYKNPVAAAAAYAAKIDIFKAGPPGKFKEGDWPCPACGNINYARRLACHNCMKKKPGLDPGEQRTGAAGGFREAQGRHASRRVDDDGGDDEYDEFGRKKKKFRGQAAGGSIVGSGGA